MVHLSQWRSVVSSEFFNKYEMTKTTDEKCPWMLPCWWNIIVIIMIVMNSINIMISSRLSSYCVVDYAVFRQLRCFPLFNRMIDMWLFEWRLFVKEDNIMMRRGRQTASARATSHKRDWFSVECQNEAVLEWVTGWQEMMTRGGLSSGRSSLLWIIRVNNLLPFHAQRHNHRWPPTPSSERNITWWVKQTFCIQFKFILLLT